MKTSANAPPGARHRVLTLGWAYQKHCLPWPACLITGMEGLVASPLDSFLERHTETTRLPAGKVPDPADPGCGGAEAFEKGTIGGPQLRF